MMFCLNRDSETLLVLTQLKKSLNCWDYCQNGRDILVMLLVALSVTTARSQGTVVFNNGYPGGPNAPVYESDGVTKLSGSQFMAELFAGPSANSLAAIAMTGFATGVQAGYFFGGAQTINSVPGGGTAWIQVDVWNTASGASFSQARASGLPDSWWQSPVFMNLTGNPNNFGGAGPGPPFPLVGLGTSPVYLNSVPEPSVLALSCLGFTAIFVGIRRHRKN
jgi:hypothetical protein